MFQSLGKISTSDRQSQLPIKSWFWIQRDYGNTQPGLTWLDLLSVLTGVCRSVWLRHL